MSYAVWPFACPASLQQASNPALVRSTVDDGYPKVRRRFTKTWRTFQVTWRLDWSEFDNFWNFHEVDCGAGSVPFYITHPMTQEQILVRWKDPPQTQADTSTKPIFAISGVLEEVFS
jgi:hypothetical protein